MEIHRKPENVDERVDRNNQQIAMEDSQVRIRNFILFYIQTPSDIYVHLYNNIRLSF